MNLAPSVSVLVRMPADLKAYIAARADAYGRPKNSELVRILQTMMQAEPLAIRLHEKNGHFLIDAGEGTDLHSAHQSRAEALTAAQALIATMPPGAADLIDLAGEAVQ